MQKPYSSHAPLFLQPKKILSQLNLDQDMTIADLGCGSGYLTFAASKMVGPSGTVYAVDVQKSVLSNISSDIKFYGARNVKPIWANLEIVGSAKIDDNSVDVALLVMILYQSKNHENILKEAYRILKPNAKLLIVDWKRVAIPYGPKLEQRVAYDIIQQKAKNAGFKFIKDIETDPYHFGILFKK